MMRWTDVQMPVRRRLARMRVGVAVDDAGCRAPERDGAERDQQHAPQHLSAALDDHRQRPSQKYQRRRTEPEYYRVPEGKPYRNSERTRALRRRIRPDR
ncbi:MAG: hypothetical protein H0U19_10135, partial [Acidobacteria bacterium]|nr:hypothetical protein [Acidobacteriota bacterium]